LAAVQHGVVARRQLFDAGVSRDAVRHRIEVERFRPLYKDVFLAGTELTSKGRYMAAVLTCGPGAHLSHRSAGDLLGLRFTSSMILEVTVPSGAGRKRGGIRIHETRALHPDDTTTVDGIPTTSWPRTLVDLASVLNDRELARALERTQILRLHDRKEIHAALERAQGRKGTGTLRRLLDEMDPAPPLTRSELERRFLELCNQLGLSRPRVNGRINGHEVDFHWPKHRLIVETDGAETHATASAFHRDHGRDLDLELAGWHVLRLTWQQIVNEPDRVAAVLRAHLARLPR
jgi:very-short-patch-repair endonuclease